MAQEPRMVERAPYDAAGPAIAVRLGDAGACLLSGTLAEDGDIAPADAADALREHVMASIDRRLGDPRLSRATIAAAHRMSPRTLDRLFGGQPWSVSGYIRHRRLEAVRRDLENRALLHRSVAASRPAGASSTRPTSAGPSVTATDSRPRRPESAADPGYTPSRRCRSPLRERSVTPGSASS